MWILPIHDARFASEDFMDDREVVMAALTARDSSDYPYGADLLGLVSMELRCDREIVMMAVSQVTVRELRSAGLAESPEQGDPRKGS